MLTKEQIADCGWTHGDHCKCDRCDRRLATMIEAVLAYSRVAALAEDWKVTKPEEHSALLYALEGKP